MTLVSAAKASLLANTGTQRVGPVDRGGWGTVSCQSPTVRPFDPRTAAPSRRWAQEWPERGGELVRVLEVGEVAAGHRARVDTEDLAEARRCSLVEWR